MSRQESTQRNFQSFSIIFLLIGAGALGRMWQNEKSANAELEHQVRIMAQKSARIVELEKNASQLVQDLNTNSYKVVAGTLSKAYLKKQIEGWDIPVAGQDAHQNDSDLNSKNPYVALNAAMGGLSNVENNLENFVKSLTASNQKLETKNDILAGVPSIKVGS